VNDGTREPPDILESKDSTEDAEVDSTLIEEGDLSELLFDVLVQSKRTLALQHRTFRSVLRVAAGAMAITKGDMESPLKYLDDIIGDAEEWHQKSEEIDAQITKSLMKSVEILKATGKISDERIKELSGILKEGSEDG
jgi:hypothetical protein